MDLTISIVSWNVRERLRECLRSITEATQGGTSTIEVFVVDNASSDGSADTVRVDFPSVQLLAQDQNLGFARANNLVLRQARGAFVLLLNPDMRLLPGTLDGIVRFLREPRNARVAVAGGHLIDGQGQTLPHVRRFPTLSDQLAIIAKLPHVFPGILDRYLLADFDYAREARVDSIRGSFFCIRRSALDDIGFLDEDFFVWFEEVDFCKRAWRGGWEVAYTPSVQCVDYVGQSFAQVPPYAKQRLFTKSMCTYFRKHHPQWQAGVLRGVRPFALAATKLRDVLYA